MKETVLYPLSFFLNGWKVVGHIQHRGWIPDRPDQRDRVYTLDQRILRGAPEKLDLRSTGNMPPVYDQGALGSCTANAIAAAVGFERHRQGLGYLIPSRLFIYWNERALEGTTGTDAGASLRDGFKTIAAQGVCSEWRWPYDVSQVTTQPPAFAYSGAVPHKTLQYLSVAQDQIDMLNCLAAGYPFAFGITVYDSFMSDAVARTGIVPMPASTETQQGGHALLACGYDQQAETILFRNSWGESWGMEGYGTIPFAYLNNQNLASDFWSVRLEQ
jgi:C1A family cysteine protease